MSDNLLSHLQNLRALFTDAAPEHPKVISDYAWTIVKALLQHIDEIDSYSARQLLADCIKLPLQHPSVLYSALLGAAIKVEMAYPEFRFAAFLRMWGTENLRPEDKMRTSNKDGKSFPSLEERMVKSLAHSMLLHPETASGFSELIQSQGYSIHRMLVTRLQEVNGKDGRKYRFATLSSPEGLEVEAVTQSFVPSPLQPLPAGKRHYVNIGQLYTVLLKKKTPQPESRNTPFAIVAAYLSPERAENVFNTMIGYIESIDSQHGHMHIYDAYSRHLVASVLRFSKERAGDFVRFVPIVPQNSKFKSAILLSSISETSVLEDHTSVLAGHKDSTVEVAPSLIREIRIVNVNKEKGYASWELVDKSQPITERLSSLQLSQGETSPCFTNGYLTLNADGSPQVPCSFATELLTPGQIFRALVYLKRGKDHQKRPRVIKLYLAAK